MSAQPATAASPRRYDRTGYVEPRMKCPHCRGRMVVRKSEQMTLTYRELQYVCQEPQCGFTCVAALEIVRTLSVSSIPNPEVRIPLSPHIRRGELAVALKDGVQSDDRSPR